MNVSARSGHSTETEFSTELTNVQGGILQMESVYCVQAYSTASMIMLSSTNEISSAISGSSRFNQISTSAPTDTHESTRTLSSSSGSAAQSDDSPSSQLLCSQTHSEALTGQQHRPHPAAAGTAQRSRCAGTSQAQTQMMVKGTQTTATRSSRPEAAALDMSGLRARRRNSNSEYAMHMITKGTQLMFLNCVSHLAALLYTTYASLFLPLISSSKIQAS
ncbi:uncharacterized protein MONOS_10713 [Monocercomonoides exilis]|uniref:uncharacterized protein n=1 Tax=Monocercomonoides exilis TaxID=2049356 RepID=UPI003559AED3|nr:hypothetical protein MONOS_10713 [Monocercomonoides exilis]|eukprot:MONOS_10713.1-p1 / transcript=MONOS_10713.1 / gene=MONOS_10713 / organism=Monocercomonoides_exilis_PA203 / gene_product=unspecified product / transcript_product=unspecified product / location=Mono_scaffold00497:33036-34494(+) / protein_length=219 / sequence_SO=supercontig / SO=protein_coding / is_pseudo=false